mmetsp:Transcript_34632/g.89821  ORF Transcript_34632/g.89821 Transcript_34632/m.89821 type:complete len:386 (+) Transcript_34632:86-1243(+)
MMNVAVVGLGCIGGYLAARLEQAGARVVVVGRSKRPSPIKLTVSDGDGESIEHTWNGIDYSTSYNSVSDCDVVFIAVKSYHTEAVAKELKGKCKRGCAVVSVQNGLRNADVMRRVLAGDACRVCAGMVSFNVIKEERKGDISLCRTTKGVFVFEADGEGIHVDRVKEAASILARVGVNAKTADSDQIQRVQIAKLLLNLNNAVNALALCPLREQLCDGGYRQVTAMAMAEAIRVFEAAGLEVDPRDRSIVPLPPRAIAIVLLLPTPIFSVVASKMLRVDKKARSSMQDDMVAGRETEIDDLNGYVSELGRKHGVSTPVNTMLAAAVHKKERERQEDGKPLVGMSPSNLLAELEGTVLGWKAEVVRGGWGRCAIAASVLRDLIGWR